MRVPLPAAMITMSSFNTRSFKLCCIITALASAFFLQACSATKLAYNQAPDIIYWWLDGYFDFNGQQSPKVRDELARLQAWHRSSELPKTNALLLKAQALMPRDVAGAQVCALFAEARGLFDNVTERVQPAVVGLAATLDVAQIEHLAGKYVKNNEKFTEDYLAGTPDERAAKRLKQALERSETIYGKLGEPQIAAIKKAIATSSFDAKIWAKERERRQQDTLQVLRNINAQRPDATGLQAQLRSLLARIASSPDAAYRAYAEKMTQEGCASFAAVHATTTPTQRAKAVQSLQGYGADIQALMGQGK